MLGWHELEAGRLTASRAAFWAELDDVEPGLDPERFALAALGLGGIWVHEHRGTLERARVLDLQRRAARLVDPASDLARRLRIRLHAEEAYVTGDLEPLGAELDAARVVGGVALAEALSLLHHCLLGPADVARRLEVADELLAVAASTGRHLDMTMGLLWRTVDLVLAGDRRAGRSLIELRERLCDHPCAAVEFVVAALEVMLAMRAGRLDDAEAMAQRGLELGTSVGDADALGWYGAQLVTIRWMQGRGGDVLDTLAVLAESPTVAEHCTGFDAAVAAVAAGCGERDVAARALTSMSSHGWAHQPSSSVWLASMHAAVEAAFLLGDRDVATQVADLLEPYAGLPIMVSLGVACLGSTHRPLGLAALLRGDVDGAIEHLEAAVAADVGLGNLPCVAIDRAKLSDALLARGEGDDRARAAELMDTAIAAASRFGMDGRVAAWAARQRRDAPDEISCTRDGRTWSLRMGAAGATVPDSVGVRYVATLLANPCVEVPAIELVAGHQAQSDSRGGQPILDEAAKRAYRTRLTELQDELADAEACADLERAARAQITIDHLVDELAAAAGLGRRDRWFADDAERARISVQKAIRRTLCVVSSANAEIGRALAARLHTGHRCVYRAASPAARRRVQTSC